MITIIPSLFQMITIMITGKINDFDYDYDYMCTITHDYTLLVLIIALIHIMKVAESR